MFCNYCGAKLSSGENFCGECGNKIEQKLQLKNKLDVEMKWHRVPLLASGIALFVFTMWGLFSRFIGPWLWRRVNWSSFQWWVIETDTGRRLIFSYLPGIRTGWWNNADMSPLASSLVLWLMPLLFFVFLWSLWIFVWRNFENHKSLKATVIMAIGFPVWHLVFDTIIAVWLWFSFESLQGETIQDLFLFEEWILPFGGIHSPIWWWLGFFLIFTTPFASVFFGGVKGSPRRNQSQTITTPNTGIKSKYFMLDKYKTKFIGVLKKSVSLIIVALLIITVGVVSFIFIGSSREDETLPLLADNYQPEEALEQVGADRDDFDYGDLGESAYAEPSLALSNMIAPSKNDLLGTWELLDHLGELSGEFWSFEDFGFLLIYSTNLNLMFHHNLYSFSTRFSTSLGSHGATAIIIGDELNNWTGTGNNILYAVIEPSTGLLHISIEHMGDFKFARSHAPPAPPASSIVWSNSHDVASNRWRVLSSYFFYEVGREIEFFRRPHFNLNPPEFAHMMELIHRLDLRDFWYNEIAAVGFARFVDSPAGTFDFIWSTLGNDMTLLRIDERWREFSLATDRWTLEFYYNSYVNIYQRVAGSMPGIELYGTWLGGHGGEYVFNSNGTGWWSAGFGLPFSFLWESSFNETRGVSSLRMLSVSQPFRTIEFSLVGDIMKKQMTSYWDIENVVLERLNYQQSSQLTEPVATQAANQTLLEFYEETHVTTNSQVLPYAILPYAAIEGGSENILSEVLESVSTLDTMGNFVPGTHHGSATGFLGIVNVTVNINEIGHITNISFTHSDTEMFADMASTVIPAIIDAQSINVTTIAGATATSSAIITAVGNALN